MELPPITHIANASAAIPPPRPMLPQLHQGPQGPSPPPSLNGLPPPIARPLLANNLPPHLGGDLKEYSSHTITHPANHQLSRGGPPAGGGPGGRLFPPPPRSPVGVAERQHVHQPPIFEHRRAESLGTGPSPYDSHHYPSHSQRREPQVHDAQHPPPQHQHYPQHPPYHHHSRSASVNHPPPHPYSHPHYPENQQDHAPAQQPQPRPTSVPPGSSPYSRHHPDLHYHPNPHHQQNHQPPYPPYPQSLHLGHHHPPSLSQHHRQSPPSPHELAAQHRRYSGGEFEPYHPHPPHQSPRYSVPAEPHPEKLRQWQQHPPSPSMRYDQPPHSNASAHSVYHPREQYSDHPSEIRADPNHSRPYAYASPNPTWQAPRQEGPKEERPDSHLLPPPPDHYQQSRAHPYPHPSAQQHLPPYYSNPRLSGPTDRLPHLSTRNLSASPSLVSAETASSNSVNIGAPDYLQPAIYGHLPKSHLAKQTNSIRTTLDRSNNSGDELGKLRTDCSPPPEGKDDKAKVAKAHTTARRGRPKRVKPTRATRTSTHSPSPTPPPSHTPLEESEDGSVIAPTSDTTQKLYACPSPTCPKLFTRRYNLQSHLRCHSGERPFVCKFCSTTFSRKHDLRRHARSLHSGERPHSCGVCSLSFARSDALKRHLVSESKRCATHAAYSISSSAPSTSANTPAPATSPTPNDENAHTKSEPDVKSEPAPQEEDRAKDESDPKVSPTKKRKRTRSATGTASDVSPRKKSNRSPKSKTASRQQTPEGPGDETLDNNPEKVSTQEASLLVANLITANSPSPSPLPPPPEVFSIVA